MDEAPFTPPNEDIDCPDTGQDQKSRPELPPLLLSKAVQRMRSLIKGNGLNTEEIRLIDAPSAEKTDIQTYRFQAHTNIRLTPEYTARTEPGRNTTAYAFLNESDFKNIVNQIIIDARTNPETRRKIIDSVIHRPDKGFGMKEQDQKWSQFSKDLARHEKCHSCGHSGHLACPKCHGKRTTPCPQCHGRRSISCIRCKGSGRINTANGSTKCTFCHGDGRMNCKTCACLGQIKCQNCAATGSIPCRLCAGSGWISHLTHLEISTHISFSFDQKGLPPLLIRTLEKYKSSCIEKKDLDITITNRSKTNIDTTIEQENTISIGYDVSCPFGPITFQMGQKEISGFLFGFQSRLVEFPFFMDELIKNGLNSLKLATQSHKESGHHLINAAKYRFIADTLIQIVSVKNINQTKNILRQKYPVGIAPKTISYVVDQSDLILRNITRRWRIIGLAIGFVLFSIILEIYFLSDGRYYLESRGIQEFILVLFDISLFPLGIMMGVFCSKFIAKWSQDKVLETIVPKDILRRKLPKAGKTIYWSIGLSAILIITFLSLAILNHKSIPVWMNDFVSLILSTFHPGL